MKTAAACRWALIAVAIFLVVADCKASDQKGGGTHNRDPVAVTRGAALGGLAGEYIIGPEDVLAVNVWKEPEISRSLPVRSDGRISLPLIGELHVAGKTPQSVQDEITTRLQAYMANPEVSVMVQEMKSHTFSVLGEVIHPGKQLLNRPTMVLDALAMAGGFRDFANKKSIYILRARSDGQQQRLLFNYTEVIKGKNTEQNIQLEAGDVIVVP